MNPAANGGLFPTVLVAQSSYLSDAASRELDFIEVTRGAGDEQSSNPEMTEALNALAWFWVITVMLGLIVMGIVAIHRSMNDHRRHDDGPRSILR
jgi:hypothetical protein